VPAQPQPAGDQREEDQPPVLRLMPPFDQRRRISTPRRPLPVEGEEEEGAVGGEVWQTPASVDAQRDFYTALLDEIDSYTRAAEVTQRMVRSLGTAQQQEKIRVEIRKRAQELKEQLEWADKTLDPRAISDAKLERAFRPAPPPPGERDVHGGSRRPHRPEEPEDPDSSRPGRSPVHERNKLSVLHLLLLFILSLRLPDVGAKEAVIFEQFGQLAGITAYLHVHVELSISSVKDQLLKYRQLLHQNCDSELAVLNYMLTYVNTSITNFTLKKDFPDRPEDFPEKSMIRQNAKLWYKVAQLHLRDLEDMGENIATLRKSLPVVPNHNTGKIPIQAQFAPPQGAHVINMQAYADTHDHLLTLIPEKSPMNLRTDSQASVEVREPRNITRPSSSG
jgi:hypothetical protein